MRGLDLFSGIGGLTKALDGFVEPVAYCENNRYAQSVLLSRMGMGQIPNAPIWDDVQTLEAAYLEGPVEIIYGGFPCQDISCAGRGAGLEGKRSGLFFEIARLVREIRPSFVFLENVPAINRRGGDIVVGTLADLGYDCRWDVLSAADVGANHRRERWWLLAHSRYGGGGTSGQLKAGKTHRKSGAAITMRLVDQVNNPKRLPTPRACDADKSIRTPAGRAKERLRRKNGEDLPTAIGGSLNPTWLEWLMGYPTGWTVLEDWAIAWYRPKRAKRLKG